MHYLRKLNNPVFFLYHRRSKPVEISASNTHSDEGNRHSGTYTYYSRSPSSKYNNIRYGLVARIHRSHSKCRCGRGSIPRDGTFASAYTQSMQWWFVMLRRCVVGCEGLFFRCPTLALWDRGNSRTNWNGFANCCLAFFSFAESLVLAYIYWLRFCFLWLLCSQYRLELLC